MRHFVEAAGTLLLFWVSCAVGQTSLRIPPTITEYPEKSVIVRSDGRVYLPCRAEGTPNITYTWKKNGADLNLDPPNIKNGVDGSITIEPAISKDEGYYQCFAGNQFGTALSIVSHIQIAFLNTPPATETNKTVKEGEQFHIQAIPGTSYPKPTYGWEIADGSIDKVPLPFHLSNRVQIADNGDLHFAYAKQDDNLGGKIYKCTISNQNLDLKAGGGYTRVIVAKGAGDPVEFAPTLGFASDNETVGFEGGKVSLRCFFYGNPEPTISWKFRGNDLRRGRGFKLEKDSTELKFENIIASDNGDYECSASNSRGVISHTIRLRVEKTPTFKAEANRLRDVNATEGESVTFSCDTDAIPEATEIVWRRNGEIINVKDPPKRYLFSPDKKSLTIARICLSCEDGDKTDISVFQCNASNKHGYAFASGYLNVFERTTVEIKDGPVLKVDAETTGKIDLECSAKYDNSTPVEWTWYRWETYQDIRKLEKVAEKPPFLLIDGGKLKFRLSNKSSLAESWNEHFGTYICVANTGISRSNETIEVQPLVITTTAPPPNCFFFDIDLPFGGIICYVIIAVIGLIVIVIVVTVIVCCYNRHHDEYDVDGKERWAGTNPEKELTANGFFESYRVETIGRTLKSSKASLSSATLLRIDEEAASLNDYGDDMGKFTEDGSFVGTYSSQNRGYT